MHTLGQVASQVALLVQQRVTITRSPNTARKAFLSALALSIASLKQISKKPRTALAERHSTSSQPSADFRPE
jgi:hypothetical protein